MIGTLRGFVSLLVAALLTAAPVHATPWDPKGRWTQDTVGSAPTPPMGWASWNAFGIDIDEAHILGSAQALLDSGLADDGYRSVNIDDGWWAKRRTSDGRMQVRTSAFPSAATGGPDGTSLRPFTDRLHAMGLKAGIYSDIGRNSCSQAYVAGDANLPQGSVPEREVGLFGHVDQDIALYLGRWNFDFIKVDACGLSAFGSDRPLVRDGTYRAFAPLVVDANFNQTDIPEVRTLYGEVRDALRAVRPSGDYVFSLCLWGSANVRSWGGDVGTMSRTSNDIDPSWGRMLHNFDAVATRELYAGPGHWNDPDMLEIGNGAFDADHFVAARTHMSLWAIEAAPLIIGTDLTKAPKAIVEILGAREVIAVDQDEAGNQGVLAYMDSERQIVVKTLADGRKAVALFNRTAMPTAMTLTAAHLKMADAAPVQLRDLWQRRDIGSFVGQRRFELAPFATILLVAKGAPVLPNGYYLSEQPGRIHVAADGIRALEADPIIHRMIDPYHPGTTGDGNRPLYAGWGAPRADATPYDEALRIANVAHRYGLGALANSRLEIRLAPGSRLFAASVGVDDSTRGKTAGVVFEVYGDGRRLARSRAQHFDEVGQSIAADVTGVRILELVARQTATDPDGNLVVDWADARIER